jgi:hypothetical protein
MSKAQSRSRTQAGNVKPVTLETVRQLALALPDVQEAVSNGSPVFRVKGKLMARLDQNGESLLIKIDYLKRDILTHAEPTTFYVTDFYRCYPMMFVRLSAIDRQMLSDLLEQAWRLTAPKRLLQAYDTKLAR